MRIIPKFATIVLASGAILFSSTAFVQAATFVDCSHLAREVTAALNANANSPNYQQAKADANTAGTACAANAYDMGVSYYKKALDLLASK